MKKIRTAARVARKIQETEAAMDQTILNANALVTALLEARMEANLAAEVGQESLDQLVSAIKSLTDARGSVARCHGGLARLAEQLQIEWRLDGPLVEKITPILPLFFGDDGSQRPPA